MQLAASSAAWRPLAKQERHAAAHCRPTANASHTAGPPPYNSVHPCGAAARRATAAAASGPATASVGGACFSRRSPCHPLGGRPGSAAGQELVCPSRRDGLLCASGLLLQDELVAERERDTLQRQHSWRQNTVQSVPARSEARVGLRKHTGHS